MIGVLLVSMMLTAAEPAAAPPSNAARPAAQVRTVDPAVATAKPKDDPNAIVCRSELPVGSRLAVKTCTTRGEAAMRRFEDRQAIEKMQGDTYR